MPFHNLGAWTGDDLKSTLEQYEGVAYYADGEVATRFLHGIAKLIRRRLAKVTEESEKGHPSVFILGSAPDLPTIKVKRIPRLNSGLTQLSGHVWFLSPEANAGNGFDACFAEDNELFDFVVSTLNAGEMPSVFFDANENVRMFRFYPKGLHQMNECFECPFDTTDVTPENIKRILDHIHQTRLVTPEAGDNNLKLWNNQDKHHPIEYPESLIQSHLVTGLSSVLISCRVKKELTGVSGRFDIAIEEQAPTDPSCWIQHAILELKVIKSFTSTGREHPPSLNLTWLESGLEQAYSYQKENSSRFSALCCFDMQKEDYGNSCFDHILEKAKNLVVELWRWYIYAKSKEYRAADAAKVIKSGRLTED